MNTTFLERFGRLVLLLIVAVVFEFFLWPVLFGGQNSQMVDIHASTFYESNDFPYKNDGAVTGLEDAGKALEKISDDEKIINTRTDVIQVIFEVINFVLSFYVIVAVLLLIYQGIRLLVARSNEERRKEVLKVIANIFIATAFILLSYVIIVTILTLIQSAGTTSP